MEFHKPSPRTARRGDPGPRRWIRWRGRRRVGRLGSGFAARPGMTAGRLRRLYSSAFFGFFIQGRVSSPLALAVISLSLRVCMVEKA